MPNSKPKKLTVKQTKFVKAYVANDGNGQEAAKIAYDVANDNSARQIASETLTKPNVKEAIEKGLIKHGITLDVALKPIAKALVARKSAYNEKTGKMDSSDDLDMQLKGSDRALKLMGVSTKEDAGSGNVFNFINNANFDSKKYVK